MIKKKKDNITLIIKNVSLKEKKNIPKIHQLLNVSIVGKILKDIIIKNI